MALIVPADPENIRRAAALIRAGHLVAFPTETVYGLGADAGNEQAVRAIFAAKGRPPTNPLIVHIAAWPALAGLADVSALAARLAERFWPGPLTLVLPKKDGVPDVVTAGGPTVAVRMPRHPVALALIAAAGVPLAAPSANRSEQLSPTRAEHVAAGLGDQVALILDGGATEVGLESTVLDLTEWPPRLLRPGMLAPSEIEAVLGVAPARGPRPEGMADQPLRAPGQMRRHYAPRTPLRVMADAWPEARQAGRPVAVLTYLPPPPDAPAAIPRIVLAPDPRLYAAGLYDALHHLDALGGETILVQAVPETDDWLAVRDRLERAAS